MTMTSEITYWVDLETPDAGGVFYYLNRREGWSGLT
jgi:hypothetical protein